MNQAWTWTAANERKAKARLGVTAYRPGQRELIQAVMAGKDALGILPTGGGKSLCYQSPALFLPHAILVVSPLISLMQDQQDKLTERNISATKLNSTLTAHEERKAVEDIRGGEPELIYVTPERLENPDYLDLLKKTKVSLFVVDEAHCISQWGHDFRPAYLALREAIRALGRPPVLALTATATPDVAADILKQLAIPKAEVVNLGINRKNLFFEVIRTVNETEKAERLTRILRDCTGGIGLVYVPTVRMADELWKRLREEGISAGRYHGKMKTADRELTQQAFMNNEYEAVVATKAFGLGIDKRDLRFVVHYAIPDSVETYVQEAGRAGRDGRPARAILLYRLEDRRVQSYFLGGKYPRREESLRVYRTLDRLLKEGSPALGVPLQSLVQASELSENRVKVIIALLDATGIVKRGRHLKKLREFAADEEFTRFLEEYEQRHAGDRERLEVMMRYGQTTMCRMRYLAGYFHEELKSDCGHCDNCRTGATDRVIDTEALMKDRQPAVGSSGY
ncbi:MAG TPA: ATP-dependent DNA helicase RecQ [Nitrospiraceae bacterium]|nr:ATP-dependent DNA helicase RecQ [Nitrospiraceae bacterium]